MKPSRIDYHGAEAVRLATRKLELIAPVTFGPRVMSLRSLAAGSNLMFEFPRDEGGSAGDEGLKLRGGHRLWHSPEHIVRTYQPDNIPLDVREASDGVSLTSPVEAKTGMQKAMTFSVVNDRTVRVAHTLTNRGLWAVETAPWALTMMRRGGYGVIPLMPKGSHGAGDLLPTYSLVPWSYTDLSLACWDLHTDYLGIDTRKAKVAQKLGLTNYPGWSAYWLDGVTFVKFAKVVRGVVYPDFGCAFETFCNDIMIEFETLGPLVQAEPGRTLTHVEHWGILDGLEKPSTDKAFAKLATAVKAWLSKL
jgi:hypothetical protein